MAKSKPATAKKTGDSASGLGIAGGAAAGAAAGSLLGPLGAAFGAVIGGIAGANTAGIADIVPMADEAQKTVRAKAKPVVKKLTAVAASAKNSVVQAVTSKKPAKAAAPKSQVSKSSTAKKSSSKGK